MLHGVLIRWVIAAGVVVNGIGCYGTRSSLQMDSDSRAPQLGIAVPISSNGTGKSAKIISASESKPKGKLVEVTVEESTEEPSRWKQWLGLSPTKPIPLPRTDLKEDGSNVEHRAPNHKGLEDF
ncbi:MAG: hypothetical protein O3A00_18530 [Planctomycetota bacterium]|nr:hypothetical protein [Planctomycetota bacterium]